jgi:integrase
VPQALKPEDVQALLRSFKDEPGRLVFLTVVLTCVRCAELQALRWSDVDLIENRLRVVDSKTKTGEWSVALPPARRAAVAAPPQNGLQGGPGSRLLPSGARIGLNRSEWFKKALLEAAKASGVKLPDGFRKMHDLRVTSITNGVRANEHGVKLQARAGHANFATTQRYIDLAGIVFHEEAAALEERMLGSSTASSTRLTAPQPLSGDVAPLDGAAAA